MFSQSFSNLISPLLQPPLWHDHIFMALGGTVVLTGAIYCTYWTNWLYVLLLFSFPMFEPIIPSLLKSNRIWILLKTELGDFRWGKSFYSCITSLLLPCSKEGPFFYLFPIIYIRAFSWFANNVRIHTLDTFPLIAQGLLYLGYIYTSFLVLGCKFKIKLKLCSYLTFLEESNEAQVTEGKRRT